MIPDDGNYSEYGGKACAHAPVRPLSKKRQHFKKCVRAPLGMSNGFQRRHLSGLLPVRRNAVWPSACVLACAQKRCGISLA